MVPNRFDEVAVLCAQHPEAFVEGDEHDATRLHFLRTVIIPTLVAIDGPDWGFLTKTDQRLPDGTFKVPCDILCWRRSRETIDCMTHYGACWIVRDAPPPEWEWTPVETTSPPDPVPPDPVPPDASVPVWYGALAMVGTIVPQPGGMVVLINPTGEVASMQPDGRIEWRAPGTVGAWELALRVGASLLVYDGTGHLYFVGVHAREL